MENDFDAIKFGKSLSNVLAQLAKSNYTSIDMIPHELQTNSIDSALALLESRLKYFDSYNFHPISASITKILAFAYHLQNDNEKFVKYGFRCISPLYQRFLATTIQEVFLNQLPYCSQLTIQLTENSSFPFDVSSGFINQFSLPSDNVEHVLLIRSLLEYDISFDSISVTVNHTQINLSSHQISDKISLTKHQKIKFNTQLPVHTPGLLTISYVTFQIHQISVNLKIFKHSGYQQTTIRPYDTECKFQIIHSDFAVTNVDYPLQIKCENIPKGAQSFRIEAKLQSNNSLVTFSNTTDNQPTTKVTETFDIPSNSIEKTFYIKSAEECNVNVNVRWSLLYETVDTSHDNNFDFMFKKSFFPSFKLFNTDRSPINLKSPPTLSTDQQYILVTTFEYNLPVSSTILKLEPTPLDSSSIFLKQVPFDVPLEVLTSEAFASVCFLTFSETAQNGSLGQYFLEYQVNNDDTVLTFKVDLPVIHIKEKFIDVKTSTSTVEEQDENVHQLVLDIKCLKTINATLDIPITDDFRIVGEYKRNIEMNPEQTESIAVRFVPTKSGKIQLHPVVVGQDGIILWESIVSSDVSI